jgi:hypothetical protein
MKWLMATAECWVLGGGAIATQAKGQSQEQMAELMQKVNRGLLTDY